MAFELDEAATLLARTPATLSTLLHGLPDAWTHEGEGGETWSAFDVVGHLIHGERTDWIPRARMILEHGAGRPFEPFDRFAQLAGNRGRTLAELLDEFERARAASLADLATMRLSAADLDRQGRHPALGAVTLRALLATWVVHDLGHVAQIARVLAKQYAGDVGPWLQYLPVLGDRQPPA